jgi:SAM-dependent methyltransferase
MNSEEYSNLARVETNHWFYVGKRDIVRFWINRYRPLKPDDQLADCGAGTGIFADEMRAYCQVVAVDDYPESIELLRARLGDKNVRKGSCTSLPLDNDSVMVLTALDVVEHVEHDRSAVREFLRVLRPGGLAVVTVPAMMCLWSDWDVSLHHYRRYHHRDLLAIIPPEFEILRLEYINVAVFPLVYAIRKLRGILDRLGFKQGHRSEDTVPPIWLNDFLRWLYVSTACRWNFRFPAGVGLLAILRKKQPPTPPPA